MKLDIMGEDTPGPGSYRGKKDMSETPRMPSSAFRSSFAQRAKTPAETPGAGAVRAQPRVCRAVACQRWRRHAQQGADRFTQGARRPTMGRRSGHVRGARRRLSGCVGREVSRAHEPLEPWLRLAPACARAAIPEGAGRHARPWRVRVRAAEMRRVDGHASAFKSGSHRLQVEEQSGDPGAYDPNAQPRPCARGDVVVWPLEPRRLRRFRRLVVS